MFTFNLLQDDFDIFCAPFEAQSVASFMARLGRHSMHRAKLISWVSVGFGEVKSGFPTGMVVSPQIWNIMKRWVAGSGATSRARQTGRLWWMEFPGKKHACSYLEGDQHQVNRPNHNLPPKKMHSTFKGVSIHPVFLVSPATAATSNIIQHIRYR